MPESKQVLTIWAKFLDPVVAPVGYVHVAIGVKAQAPWHFHLTIQVALRRQLDSNEASDRSPAAVTNATKVAKNPFALPQIAELVKDELRPKYGDWGRFDDWMQMNVLRIILEGRMGWN